MSMGIGWAITDGEPDVGCSSVVCDFSSVLNGNWVSYQILRMTALYRVGSQAGLRRLLGSRREGPVSHLA